jgi:hypothetical protein
MLKTKDIIIQRRWNGRVYRFGAEFAFRLNAGNGPDSSHKRPSGFLDIYCIRQPRAFKKPSELIVM